MQTIELPELQQSQLPSLEVPALTPVGEPAQGIRPPDYVAKYDLSGIPAEVRENIERSTDDDEKLFAAHVGLQRFINERKYGQLSPEVDADRQLLSHLGQIANREFAIDHPKVADVKVSRTSVNHTARVYVPGSIKSAR